jgi:phosphate transport system substrate-binding protein
MRIVIAIAASVLMIGACCRSQSLKGTEKPYHLLGSGSSFIAPMMKKWARDYEKAKGIEIDYISTGSGIGVDHLLRGINDFACTDLPLSGATLREAEAAGGEVVQIPLALGAVVVVYNLPEVEQQLQVSGPVVADIFLGKITRWNDPAIKELNAGVELPNELISVVHRGDASATTALFTDYLTEVSQEWKDKVGTGLEVIWPVGAASIRATGPAQLIRTTPGAIGYLELIYLESLEENPLHHAKLKNRDGCFVQASLSSVTATAEKALADIPDDLRFSLINVSGKDSYPICGAVWAVVYAKQTGDRGKRIVDFLTWATHEGQESVTNLCYARLPEGLVQKVGARLRRIQ